MPVSLEEARSRLLAAAQPRQAPTLAELCARTVGFELHSWQRDHLCPLLQRCKDERGLRIAIHGPPQYGKSIITSQRFPAWLIGVDPTHRVGLACYNETHATRFGSVIKDLIRSDAYRSMFPHVSLRADAASGDFQTEQRKRCADGQPSFHAMGLLSGFTGKGVDTLIIDDPYKSAAEARSEIINENVWQWWSETAGPRVPDTTNVIVMFHRYHEDDLAGRLLATGKFENVRFPAVADSNEDGSDPTGRQPGELLSPMRSREWLQEQEEQNPQMYLGQFQGKPRPEDGALFKREWFKVMEMGEVPRGLKWVRFWDFAASEEKYGDRTAGALCAIGPDHTLIIKDVTAFRMEWPDACELIADIATAEHPEVALGGEKAALQKAFIQDLVKALKTRGDKVAIYPLRPVGDKKERASGWAARAKFDKVRLVRGAWNQEFIEECMAFPHGKHDDRVDAVSGAYELLYALRNETPHEQKTYTPGTVDYYRQLARRK